MNITDFKEEELNEAMLPPRVSAKAKKLINKLEKKERETIKKIEQTKDALEKRELKENLFAIRKALPVVKKFEEYFIRLETRIKDTSDKKRRKYIEKKYDEIKRLFINDLFDVMRVVGYDASAIIASTILSVIVAIVFIPGGLITVAPAFALIKKIKEIKEKVKGSGFKDILEKVQKELERKKRTTVRSYYD